MKNGFVKKISEDFSLNILASILSTGIMQLVVYPSLAKQLSSVEYGTMLTAMGYVSVVTLALGNNLCNARLVQESKYKEKGIVGDFQILKIVMSVLSAIAIIITCYNLNLKSEVLIALIIATILTILKSYYLVAYRIKIDYRKNLIANMCIGIGYVVGVVVLLHFLSWPWVFSCGCFAGIIYIYFSTNIVKESYKKTALFKDSFKVVFVLAIGGIISNATTYLDRFLIYPILGGASVSIYATAAFFSKSLNLLLAPITSVLLSYLTAKKIVLNVKKYVYLNIVMMLFGAIFWFVSISIGNIITGILYPTLIDSAIQYIPMVSFGIIFSIVGTFSNIVILACSSIKWQTILPLVKFIIYIVLGYFWTVHFQLSGLCMTVVVINVVMFLLTFIIGLISIKKEKE